MTDQPRSSTGPASAVAVMSEMAAMVQVGCVLLGLLYAGEGLVHGHGPAHHLIAIVRLGVFSLAGRVTSRILIAAGSALELFAAQVEVTARLAATADRLAAGALGPPTAPGTHPTPARSSTASDSGSDPDATPRPDTHGSDLAADPRVSALAAAREAIRRGQWAQAEALVQTFADTHPDDRLAAGLVAELDRARESVVADLRARIDAARAVNDALRIFELHEEMAPLLASDSRRELERDLARWLMGQVQKRLRTGKITVEVATLATRVAETFNATPEGASLRAALPTLRRSVGLCARCARPYTGIADACPACLGTVTFPADIAFPPESDGPLPPEETSPVEETFPEHDGTPSENGDV